MTILATAIMLPMIDHEMMRAPLADAILDIRQGNVAALRECFQPGATLAFQQKPLAVETVIDAIAPLISARELRNSARLGDYTNIRQQPGELADADFSVWLYLEGSDDLPYKRIPLQKKGHVTLKRVGWFRWKIQRISSSDPEFGDIVGSAMRAGTGKP